MHKKQRHIEDKWKGIREHPFIILSSWPCQAEANVGVLPKKLGNCFNFNCITWNYLELMTVKWDPAHQYLLPADRLVSLVKTAAHLPSWKMILWMEVLRVFTAEYKYGAVSGLLYAVSCQKNRFWSQRHSEHNTSNLVLRLGLWF